MLLLWTAIAVPSENGEDEVFTHTIGFTLGRLYAIDAQLALASVDLGGLELDLDSLADEDGEA